MLNSNTAVLFLSHKKDFIYVAGQDHTTRAPTKIGIGYLPWRKIPSTINQNTTKATHPDKINRHLLQKITIIEISTLSV